MIIVSHTVYQQLLTCS